MRAARFTSFELLLLESHHQADTAATLLLAWVLSQQGPLDREAQAHLARLTHHYRHGHDLTVILATVAQRDLQAVQLAAEVLQRRLRGEAAHPFLGLAIQLAAPDGRLSLAGYHALGFLADLLGVAPNAFAALFRSMTARPFTAPADPSRRAYWSTGTREGAHRHDQEEHSGAGEEHRSSREDARRGQDRPAPPGERLKTERALAVLGLAPGATPREIRLAYRRLAQAHHPDRFHHEGEAVVARASRRFQRIRSAYDYLTRAA